MAASVVNLPGMTLQPLYSAKIEASVQRLVERCLCEDGKLYVCVQCHSGQQEGINVDPELQYPKGAGCITFSSWISFKRAVSCQFFQVVYGDIDKMVEVKPYVFDDHLCDECHGVQRGGRLAPYFCETLTITVNIVLKPKADLDRLTANVFQFYVLLRTQSLQTPARRIQLRVEWPFKHLVSKTDSAVVGRRVPD
eukprot:Em0012g5a